MPSHHRPKEKLSSARFWGAASAYNSFYFVQFMFLGVFLPFFPGWLDDKGFSAADIGAISGGALVLRLILAPVFAYRAESFADPRTGVRIVSAAMAIFAIALVFPIPAPVIVVSGVLLWFVFGLLVPITDTAVLRADRRGELKYGQSRGVGSGSFVLATLIGGAVVSAFGDGAVVVWSATAACAVFVVAMSLPKEPNDNAGEKRPRPSLGFALALFRSKSFLLLIFSSGLCQGSHATYYAFSELHWSALGYSSFTIGCLWAIGVVCEIVFLFTARPLMSRFGAPALIVAGTLAALVRWPIVGLSPPIFILVILQALHAFTFAAAYLGMVEFIDRAVPSAYRTTAMTLVSSLGVGAMTGVATIAVGAIFDRTAPFPAYALMAVMGAGGLILAIWLYRRWDGGLLKAVPGDDESTG